MPVDLLDINVWLALSDADHVHHLRAKHYWENESSASIAFNRLTMLGLLRLVTNSKVMAGQPFSGSDAWALYRRFLSEPGVTFLSEPSNLENLMEGWVQTNGFPLKGWTDCALAGWARAHGCRIVSFDQDFHWFEGVEFLHLRT
jgi:toxin-antitoxin system PIN domain toxin